MPDFETEYTREIVCPHCGYVHGDSWEVEFGEGMDGDTEMDCHNCAVEFAVSRIGTIEYTSTKIERDPAKELP